MKPITMLKAGLEFGQLIDMHKKGKLHWVKEMPDISDFINVYPLSLLGLVSMNKFKEVCEEIGLRRKDDQFTLDFDATCLNFSIRSKDTVEDLRKDLAKLMVISNTWDRI
jgi:hypothetical protein